MSLRRGYHLPVRPWVRLFAAGIVAGVLAAGVVTAVVLHPSSPDSAPPAAPQQASRILSTSAPTGPLDPTRFGPGGCLALGPTVADRHQTVFLDAGHGGPDPGSSGTTASGRSVDEKDLTLPVALATAELLRTQGYRVVLSRTDDSVGIRLTTADLNGDALSTTGNHAQLLARARCANLAGAAVLVSIHFDAFADASARGATTLYDPARSFAAANARLAALLQDNIAHGFADVGRQVPDRGVLSDTASSGGEQTSQGETYGHPILLGPAAPGYVDEPTLMPGALVEPLFISNPAEASLAVSPVGRQALAQAIARGIDQFLQQR